MSLKQKYVLGEPVPNNPHAVVSNVPTLADVCAYEEHADYVVSAMKQGYPRFVQHAWVNQLIETVVKNLALEASYAVLVQKNTRMQSFVKGLGDCIHCRSLSKEDYGMSMDLVFLDTSDGDKASVIHALKLFIQHTGYSISSRMAEKALSHLGELQSSLVEVDQSAIESARTEAYESVADLSSVKSKESIMLTSSGMNAFYSAFKAMQATQLARGKTKWLQLGWVYVDSGNILQKYLSPEETLSVHYDILDTEAIVAKIEAMGDALSVVVLECPTNPFCQIADLKFVAECVHRHGGLLLIDPSIVSLYNIDCFPYADVLVTSLTKYAAHTGDVMAGAILFNEASPVYLELKKQGIEYTLPLDDLDMLALNKTLQSAESHVQTMNSNCRALVDFLKSHSKIKKVFSVQENKHHKKYLKHEQAYGSIISIELYEEIKDFYDTIQFVKGPSFGTQFTIICPYFYLAHYELVQDKSTSGLLYQLGIDRNLIRISVGCEPIEIIIAEFSRVLESI